MIEIITESAAETKNIGATFARFLRSGDTILLNGDLGSGKTVFVSGAAAGLGYKGAVTSPTFTLVHEYGTVTPLFHIDCFRLHTPQDIISLGIEDYLALEGIIFAEWADRIAGHFDAWSWEINLEFVASAENKRRILIKSGRKTEVGDRLCNLQAFLTESRQAVR